MNDTIEKNLMQGTKLLMGIIESFPYNFCLINNDSTKLNKNELSIKNSMEYILYQQIRKEKKESMHQWMHNK